MALLATACGSNSITDTSVFTSQLAVAAGTEPVHLGRLAAVLVSEADAGATDLNGDGDTNDSVVAVLDLEDRTETQLGLAAVDLEILGEDVFILVDVNAQTAGGGVPAGAPAFELHHWRRGDVAPTFVDGVEAAAPTLINNGSAVFYAAFDAPAAGESNLACVESSAPTIPVRVPTLSGATLFARPLGAREGLVFIALPEGAGLNPDLNGDADTNDAAVLAFADGTVFGSPLVETGFALPAQAGPAAADLFDAQQTATDDWLIAFLVGEDEQGADLDDPALFPPEWLPEGCPGLVADAGAPLGEDVLFVTTLLSAIAGDVPVNTGLVGADRVVVGPEVAATLSSESAARCDLNGDGTLDDMVARWVHVPEAGEPAVAIGSVADLIAVADAGPSRGLAVLGRRLIIVADEAADGRDYDGDATDNALVGSREPGDATEDVWMFENQSGVGTFDEDAGQVATEFPFVGTAWLAAEEDFARLPVAYQESVSGLVLNRNDFCDDRDKDGDTTDSVASWIRVRSEFERGNFEPDLPLTFPGSGYALAADPGFVLASARAFLRVSETDDARDYNGDGDRNDTVVFESGLNVCFQRFLGESTVAGTGPVAFSDGVSGAVFLSAEAHSGVDLNGDGDTTDEVLRFFRF